MHASRIPGLCYDTIVAGAPGHTVGTNAGQGAAFVFVKPAAGWKDARETATLTASDGARNEALGSTVAVSGGTVAVGAPGRTVGTNQIQGAVYVFVKPAARWKNTTQTAELTASDGATSDDLNSVSMSGDTIAAGAQSHTVGTHQAQGAIYVFVKPAFGWADATQTAELTASDGAAGDDLGAATVATNDTIVAGASQAQIANNKREGAAYVFVKPAAGWVDARQTAKLTASDGSTDDFFATNVGLSGGTVVAGAPGHALGANQLQGAVYLFVKPRSGWADASQTEELGNPSDVAAGGLFGYGVAISGTLVVASSPFETVGGNTRQGVVHLLAAPPTIALDNPADGGTFTQGQIADASFSCAAPTGATIIRCAGPVTADAPIDTSSLGAHVFTVGAIDSDGATATRSVKYTVTPGHGSTGPASRPPSISAVHQSAEVWRRGGKPARLALARKPPVGTTFSFALDQPATVTLSFGHRSAGRRTHGVCARPSAKNNRAARCTRTIAAGTLKLTGHRGPNRVHFEGRISPTRRLRPGQYTLTMTATNAAGQRASARALRFRIVK